MPRHPVILRANDIRNCDPGRAAEMVEALLLENDPSASGGGAYDLLGQIYLVAGDIKSARDSFQKDLEVYPDSHSTFLYMGLVEEVSGNDTAAKRWYGKAPEREFDGSYISDIKSAASEWGKKHPNSESRIELLEAGTKPPPLFSQKSQKRWWEFWKS